MTDTKLKLIIENVPDLVFARITPGDKLRIVQCCRDLKQVVAVTGIGSADLQVFEKADVCLSMGQYGSDITKRYSDVILLGKKINCLKVGFSGLYFTNKKRV